VTAQGDKSRFQLTATFFDWPPIVSTTNLFIGNVDVGAVIAEQLDDLPLVGAQRQLAAHDEVKRALELVIDRVDVSSVFQKQSHHVEVAGVAGEVQSRAAVDDFTASGRAKSRLDATSAAAAAATVRLVMVGQLGPVVGIGTVLYQSYRTFVSKTMLVKTFISVAGTVPSARMQRQCRM
jgi:hypothetical protein